MASICQKNNDRGSEAVKWLKLFPQMRHQGYARERLSGHLPDQLGGFVTLAPLVDLLPEPLQQWLEFTSRELLVQSAAVLIGLFENRLLA